MTLSFSAFFRPYYDFLYGGAYSLYQTLEGLNWAASNFVKYDDAGMLVESYWSPSEAVMIPLGGLMLLTFFLIPWVAMAAHALGGKRGVFIFFLLSIAPGFLNVLGFFPSINYLPGRFVIQGAGTLGSELGIVPILVLGALAGWTTIILIYDNFSLGDRFRQCYDHLWFSMAIVAAVFFVADNGANENISQLKEATAEVQKSSEYLLGQVRTYESYCDAHGLNGSSSCQWSAYVQQELGEIAVNGEFYFKEFGPDSSADIYKRPGRGISPEKIIQIRKEIAEYNQKVCPVVSIAAGVTRSSPSSRFCERVPSTYCSAFPDKPNVQVEDVSLLSSVALGSECIVPSLVASKPQITKLVALAAQAKKAKHHRLFYFLAASIILGGKIANSTTKVVEMDSRAPAQRRRAVKVFSKVWSGIRRFITRLLCALGRVLKKYKDRVQSDA